MFNCGESHVRLLQQNQFRFNRIAHILLTRTDWSSMAGLLPLSFVLGRELESRKAFNMHVPLELELQWCKWPKLSSKLERKLTSSRCFFPLGINYNVHMYADTPEFNDELLTIRAVDMHTNRRVRSYLVTVKAREYVHIVKEKLMSLGLPLGPWVRLLKEGIDYKAPDGEQLT